MELGLKNLGTSSAGLGTLIEAFDVSQLSKEFEKTLPDRISARSQGRYRLGLIQVASFLRGHDCNDDVIEFPHASIRISTATARKWF